MVIFLFVALFLIASFSFVQYFIRWGQNIYTYHAFNGRYWDIGNYLESLPLETEKYVIINAWGILVKGIQMPAQTVMFATNTYTESAQKNKNIIYLLPEEIESINCSGSCVIVSLQNNSSLRETIKEQIPGLSLIINPGIEILIK